MKPVTRRRHLWRFFPRIFPLPFGYDFNGAWHGFGEKRSKDGDVWCIQLWHPTKANLLLFSRRPWVRRG